jgi:YegS/Rv2252/BmrU family lipid kinase
MADDPTKPLFIVNPVSGGGRTKRRIPALEAAIRRAGIEPDIILTEHRGHGTEIARDAIEAGRETIIAVGGDGTVYEVANAILDAAAGDRVRLGTIGMGTGKDVARCLGMGEGAAAIRAIADGSERCIDAGRIDLHDAEGNPITRYFLLEASSGWIPEISSSVPRWLKRLGDTAPYVIMTFARMLGPMSREFAVAIDGEAMDGRYNSISVHNMELWGGDMTVVPGAKPDDGLLDAIRWGPLGRGAVLKAVQGQRKGGGHLDMEGIDHHPARTLVLASPKRTMVDLDGEHGGYLPATVRVVPGALRFLAPAVGNMQ